jgi:YbgC/YbaW family acyl-CoA thioester hydrolase
MNRVKIDLPKEFIYNTTIPIRISDLNYGGHVGNDTILTLLHEARVQFLAHYQFSEMDFGGAGLIMKDVDIEFKNEIFYGDIVTVYVALSDFSRIGFNVNYKMIKSSGNIIAIAKTGMICYDYKLKKIVSIPQKALTALQ